MCTGNFMERYPSDAGNGIQRPPAGSKCAKPCVFESGRWGSSWCYTEENGSEEKGSQWGAECVSCQGMMYYDNFQGFCWKKIPQIKIINIFQST